jgi:hypothetical protein
MKCICLQVIFRRRVTFFQKWSKAKKEIKKLNTGHCQASNNTTEMVNIMFMYGLSKSYNICMHISMDIFFNLYGIIKILNLK